MFFINGTKNGIHKNVPPETKLVFYICHLDRKIQN